MCRCSLQVTQAGKTRRSLPAPVAGFTAPTRAERGCVFYDLHENPADPEDLTFIEEWDSAEDLDAHSQSAHIQAGRKQMPDLMDLVDVRRYQLITAIRK